MKSIFITAIAMALFSCDVEDGLGKTHTTITALHAEIEVRSLSQCLPLGGPYLASEYVALLDGATHNATDAWGNEMIVKTRAKDGDCIEILYISPGRDTKNYTSDDVRAEKWFCKVSACE